MNVDLMFSSGKDDWETPQELFAALDAEFFFQLDACATQRNKKCHAFFSPEDDGLEQDWVTADRKHVFCNPPYSRGGKEKRGQADWIAKAAAEGTKPGAVVVMLLPVRTDTKAFHEYIYGRAEIRFLRGRVKFLADGQVMHPAPFPSMIVIFRGEPE